MVMTQNMQGNTIKYITSLFTARDIHVHCTYLYSKIF